MNKGVQHKTSFLGYNGPQCNIIICIITKYAVFNYKIHLHYSKSTSINIILVNHIRRCLSSWYYLTHPSKLKIFPKFFGLESMME